VLTHPRRWGKTLHLEMIGFFLPELNKEGDPQKDSSETRRKIFAKLKINN
jgi:hypothetical protein